MKLLGATLWLLLLLAAYWIGSNAAARIGPAAASTTSFEAALDHRDPLARSFQISRFLSGVEAQGIDDVAEAVEAEGHRFDRQEHRLLMAAWVPIDPDEAALWAFSRPGILRERAADAALEALGYSSAPRALFFLESMKDRNLSDSLHLSVVRGWARSDYRDELSDYLAAQPPSVYRQQALAALANEILKGGPDELIGWVDSIDAEPNSSFKRTAFQKAAHALAQRDPPRAASWVEEHLSRPYALRAPNVVARSWAEKDTGAAMSWLVSLPQESTQKDRVGPMFSQWLGRAPRSAENWIRAEPPSEARDPLIRIIIRSEFERRPAVAMEWAHLLHDPTVRKRVQISAGRSWYRKDPDTFMAWLPEGGLEQDVRDLILNAPMRQQFRSQDQPEREPTS